MRAKVCVCTGIIPFNEGLDHFFIFHVMKEFDFGVILNSLQVVGPMGAGMPKMGQSIDCSDDCKS